MRPSKGYQGLLYVFMLYSLGPKMPVYGFQGFYSLGAWLVFKGFRVWGFSLGSERLRV